ncbi:thiamine phosphate synthase [Pelagibacterales bacterium SAG-MED12]|nr:thiamine phosphate synthase [Pelagibacterales bacterium SAG-MED12]
MHYWLPKKYYFINELDTNTIKKCDHNTAIIYRNYNSKIIDILKILNLKNYLKKRKSKFLLSNNIKLALKLGLDGAYIPSFNKDLKHLSYSINSKFLIVGSAHNLREIRIKELQKAKAIFLSSLFKQNKNFLGLNKFRKFSNYTENKIIALGGISKKNVKKLKLLDAYGFAGISYFE